MKKFYYCCYFLFVLEPNGFASDKLQESYFTENNKMGITLKHQKKQLI